MNDLEEKLKYLPDKPGIYMMKDIQGNIIYVGKASVLKNRVRQYFQSLSNQSLKTQVMVSKIVDFQYIVTDSETEALILECNLIKKYKPKFNILLKDDKQYPYIKITNEIFPKVVLTRRMQKDNAKYFGPYPNTSSAKNTLKLLHKLFPIRECKRDISKNHSKLRSCLNFHIGKCKAPCLGKISKEEYANMVKDIIAFLNGKHSYVMQKLEREMVDASNCLNFELAAQLRDRVSSLKYVAEKQKIISTSLGDQDVIAFDQNHQFACFQVFFIRNGKLTETESFFINLEDAIEGTESQGIMTSFLKQFYFSNNKYIPGEILLQEEIEDLNNIEKLLSERRKTKTHLIVPKKGEKLGIVKMAQKNASLMLNEQKRKQNNAEEIQILKQLAGILKLKELPRRIEAYDISNTGMSEMVAAMVVFQDGRPSNNEYRKFKIKTIKTQNDYACMQEVMYRRFKYIKDNIYNKTNDGRGENIVINSSEEDEINNGYIDKGIDNGYNKEKASSFLICPDIILVDGGMTHVNGTIQVLKALNVNIPVFGMVKNEYHKTRGIMACDGEINISDSLAILKFITEIQNEVHRVALAYNKQLRKRRYISSELDQIQGIGPAKKKALFKHFGSLKEIKNAGVEELLKVSGVNLNLAKKIFELFHS